MCIKRDFPSIVLDRGPKLWNNYLDAAEENAVSKIFFKRKIKDRIFLNNNELFTTKFCVYIKGGLLAGTT